MKWFEGDINSAVVKSKSEKAIFVVFIEGNSLHTQYKVEKAHVSKNMDN